jgi:hypothetical protein
MLVPNAFDLTPRIRPGRVSDQQLDDCLDDRMYRQGRALLGLKQSREHTRQKVAARHAPAIFPPADPHSVTSTTRDPPLLKPIQNNRARPNSSAKHADSARAQHGERPNAWPARFRPYQHTLRGGVTNNSDGSADSEAVAGGGGGGGGGARRARSSTRSPATRTAKMRGGAAARNIAVCDDRFVQN